MHDHVVVDVEIQKTVEETPGGWDATDKLGVAVACVWEYRTARMRVYGPDDVGALRERLMAADRISGFNIFNFDFPVIWGVAKQDWLFGRGVAGADAGEGKTKYNCSLKVLLERKTDDMLRRIWQAKGLNPDQFSKETHGGVGLDAVAGSTIGARKIGYGGDAPRWYQAGQWARVANYCADDVAIERDLCDFVERYGYVVAGGKQLHISQWRGGA